MIEIKLDFDLEKLRSYDRNIIQPYAQNTIRKSLKKHRINPKDCVFRGGFGRTEDIQRLKDTGSDYEKFLARIQKTEGAAIYASLFEYLGTEPWIRGLDPLYWALKGHNGVEFNPVNVLAAFWKNNLIIPDCSDIYIFKSITPSKDNLAALIYPNLINKQ